MLQLALCNSPVSTLLGQINLQQLLDCCYFFLKRVFYQCFRIQ
uniref:Macaca fascicularis brain cDNA clone: QflA-17667, similar to human hypothetical protein FLJ34048 (FLJ34048), mRNA, RefSeq: XM_380131.1 n=1 Tax=Macaca fascicularis TaxID=9541 RepID=I7GLC4_MACFA|nr:unnamed protein product [Macaca fascicularis]